MLFSKPLSYASMASTVSAFVSLADPVPFAYDGDDLYNMPIDFTGSNFPCNSVTYTIDHLNVFEAGSLQDLRFKGQAVAGGGSCQVSVTTDLKPNKSSVWKVIKSIEGGCPAQNQPGKLEGGTVETPIPYVYNFTVPDIGAGRYTLAWTWFNKIGNREMYMHCAPLEITGGEGSTQLNSLPDMFIANMRGVDCVVPESTDVLFPNPGKDVERLNGATTAFAAPEGSQCTGAPSQAASEVPSTTPASQPTDIPSTTADQTASGPKDLTTADGVEKVDVPAGVPMYPGVTEVFKYASGHSCADVGDKTCNCIDGHSFQLCEDEVWGEPKPVGEGMVCYAGQALQIAMSEATS